MAGLGITLFRAIGFYDTPVIVGSTIIYAYLLAITVFLLDFVYALVDPRVKVGSGKFTMNALKNSIRDLLRYPSAILGLVIIFFLMGVAVYALVTIPYSEAVRLWRGGRMSGIKIQSMPLQPGLTFSPARKSRCRLQ